MTDRNAEPRYDRRHLGDRVLPFQSGELPEDFQERLEPAQGGQRPHLERLLAQAIGADRNQVRRWRKVGAKPTGGAYHCLVRFASLIRGGLEILLEDEGFQMPLWDEDTES